MGVRPTTFSAFGFGVSWEFTKSDRVVAQKVLDFLADKRVLTVGHVRPQAEATACLASAAECRSQLSTYLDQLEKPGGDLRTWLRAMREGFTAFIEAGGHSGQRFGPGSDARFNEALARLQSRVQQQADEVSDRYKLPGLSLLEH
ncbi:hypothetical protein NHG22_31175 [Streptomyces sp. ATE26]|uniref:DUF6650 family protein n=1 Tax=Streptomyces sp. ATE26 TaxID=2954237 RepID=UPI00248240D8|nr:DUF6650 family protein [Streptomyces sp. ATE26]MDI1458234.1 hypothetical protein [Streptomyces sp. ATE26]